MRHKLHLIDAIQQNDRLLDQWRRLSPQRKQILIEIDEGIRVPPLLADNIFKGLFDPDIHTDRLERFVSSVLRRPVKILGSLKQEGYQASVYKKKIILDLLVRFSDGSLGNVEIQRKGANLPPARAVSYSADLISRQFARARNEATDQIDYSSIHPVYTIVLMEDSGTDFSDSNAYIHHFQQTSDTGINLEFLQYYDYVCLDKFKHSHPRTSSELERWLTFFSIEYETDMEVFLKANPDFQNLYNSAIMMLADREEMLSMVENFIWQEDVVGSILLTREGMHKREIEKKELELKEKEIELEEKNSLLEEKDLLILSLREEINKLKNNN